MKKLIMAASSIALLGACSEVAVEEEAVEEVAVAEVMTDANGDTMEAYLGEWDVVYPDGSTGISTNNADGTYTAVPTDGEADNGTWSFGAEESCWTSAVTEDVTCYTVGAADENGTRILTMADGNTISVTPRTEAAEE